MSNPSKEQTPTTPLGPHDLFILGEDGNYYHLDNEQLSHAKPWSYDNASAAGHDKTNLWLMGLKETGSTLAIHLEPEKMKRKAAASDDDVDAVLCVMLNYRSISQSFTEVAKKAFELGRQAARQEEA